MTVVTAMRPTTRSGAIAAGRAGDVSVRWRNLLQAEAFADAALLTLGIPADQADEVVKAVARLVSVAADAASELNAPAVLRLDLRAEDDAVLVEVSGPNLREEDLHELWDLPFQVGWKPEHDECRDGGSGRLWCAIPEGEPPCFDPFPFASSISQG